MFSERHRTEDVRAFLNKWLMSGAQIPTEVVMDQNKALMNAAILSFCPGFNNIYEYSDSFKVDIARVKVRIRIDNAHFINTHTKLLSDLNRKVKIFYLAVIGQLILCETLEDAEEIFTSLFILSNCESGGSKCFEEIEKIKSLIVGKKKLIM